MNLPNGMSTLGQKLKHELRELIPVTVFFFGTFQLLALTQALILEQFGIRVSAFLTATVMALLVAKVVLITEHFPLMNRFSDKPLSYSVAWKTAIYFIASLVVRYVEHLIHFWRQTGNFAEANRGWSRKSSGRISGPCNSGCLSCCWFIARFANWFGLWAASGS
jgi:hypothetical protein